MGPHFMFLLSIYVLYSNIISCIVFCGNKIVSNSNGVHSTHAPHPCSLFTRLSRPNHVPSVCPTCLSWPSEFRRQRWWSRRHGRWRWTDGGRQQASLTIVEQWTSAPSTHAQAWLHEKTINNIFFIRAIYLVCIQ